MKTLYSLLFCSLLVACSPKYQEINGNGFGGGSSSFKKSQTVKKDKADVIVENETGLPSMASNDHDEKLLQVSKNVQYTKLGRAEEGLKTVVKSNSKGSEKMSLAPKQIKKKIKSYINQVISKKSGSVDSDFVNAWFKVFLILLVISASAIVLAGIILITTFDILTAFAIFKFGYYLGMFSLFLGLINLILWLMSL